MVVDDGALSLDLDAGDLLWLVEALRRDRVFVRLAPLVVISEKFVQTRPLGFALC